MISARPRVVVVTHDAPDPFGNPASRWYAVLLRGLAERGYRVTCWSGTSRPEFVERARRYLADVPVDLHLVPFPTGRRSIRGKLRTLREPFSYFIAEEFREGVRREMDRGYDVLHLEQMWCGYLGLDARRTLLSVHHLELLDLAGTGFRAWDFFKAKRLAWRAERHLLRRFSDIRVTTDRLAHVVRSLNADARLHVVPIAVDSALYPVLGSFTGEKVVGLIAGMTWEPGYTAAVRLIRFIWPRVRERASDARLVVAGWHARSALTKFVSEPGVTIVENLSDALEFYRNCSVLAYPLTRGSGMKVKIIETMALGVPVVTTVEGIEGVDVESGTHAFIEEDDTRFAERIVQLLDDPALRDRFSKAGRALVEERYSPAATVTAIERVYERMRQA